VLPDTMAWPSSDFSSNALPFAPRAVYLGRSQSEARVRITETIDRRDGLIVLTGESGTGKTTLCLTILQNLAFPTVRSDIVNPHLNFEELLKQILVDLGVVTPKAAVEGQLQGIGAHDLVLMLNRFLEGMSPQTRAILVLDDAHQIPRGVLAQLRTLANLQTRAGRQLLQIILIGRPRLEMLFTQPQVRQLKQRVACHCRLEPLDASEVAEYVRHRLKSSRSASRQASMLGFASAAHDRSESEEPVAEPALSALATLSRGIPRTLNLLCDSAAALAVERQTTGIGLSEVLEAGRRLKVRPPVARRVSARVAAFVIALLTIALAVTLVNRWSSRRSAPPQRQPTATERPSATPQSPGSTGQETTPAERVVDQLQASDSFVVVVASFRSQQRATDTARELNAANLPAFVRDDDEWHVLVVGPYLTEDEAREARGRISQTRFSDAHVVRSGPGGYRPVR
jgi:type II secretory pathway predicted ATPase ExeA